MITLGLREWRPSAQIPPSPSAVFNTLTGSLPSEFTLHLSKPCQQSHHQWSHLPQCLRIDQPVQRSNMDSLLLKVVEAVDHFHLSSAQAIQLRDHQFVPSFQNSQAGLELVALLGWCSGADHLVVNGRAPSLTKQCQLSVGGLVPRRYPCVADGSCQCLLTNHVSNTSTKTGFMNGSSLVLAILGVCSPKRSVNERFMAVAGAVVRSLIGNHPSGRLAVSGQNRLNFRHTPQQMPVPAVVRQG